MKNEKTIGKLIHLDINLTTPTPLKMDGDVNSLVVLVGPNGIGKSLVMIINWLVCQIAALHVSKMETVSFLGTVTEIITRSFDNPLSGSITAHFERGLVSLYVQENNVTNCSVNTDATIPTSSLYMSKETRSFSNVMSYVRLRDLASKTNSFETVVYSTYKFYDIQFMETLITKATKGIVLPVLLKDFVAIFGTNEIVVHHPEQKIEIFFEEEGFYIHNGNTKLFLHKLSAGLQAMLIIIAGQS